MKVGVISDIHDNIHNARIVFKELKEKQVEKILFLGDANSPFIAKDMANLGIPVVYVWGNNEGDEVTITKFILGGHEDSIVSSESFLSIEIDNRKLFLVHFPELAEIAINTDMFDAVFYGHNHEKLKEKRGEKLFMNPGSIFANKGLASYAIYDTEMNDAEIFEIEDSLIPNS